MGVNKVGSAVDDARMAATVEALLALAARVEATTAGRTRDAAAVIVDWQGPHRDRFDTERSRLHTQAADVIVACRRLSAR